MQDDGERKPYYFSSLSFNCFEMKVKHVKPKSLEVCLFTVEKDEDGPLMM